MAGAVNIKFGAVVGGFTSGISQMGNSVKSFSSQAKSDIGGLAGIADPALKGLGDLNRQLAITKFNIANLAAAGGSVPGELVARYRGLQSVSESTRQILAKPLEASAFGDLNNRLSETKAKMQDLLAAGKVVPQALAAEYEKLESEVKRVNNAFARPVPISTFSALTSRFAEVKSQMQDLLASGKSVPQALANEYKRLEAQVNQVARAFDRVPAAGEKLGKIGSALQSFGRQAALVSAGIALIATTSFKTYADINALQLGLENITGSAAGAEARFKELMPVIKLPGLGLEEAVKGDVRLQAVGFSATTAKNALLQFGNAIALTGGGKFELDSVITQLTQMGSKARVLSEDLKPILTASPAVAKAIKQMFGTVDSEQISAKLQATGRGPQEFIQDLIAKLSQLERVSGGPKNAIENFGDSVKLAQFEFGKAADKAFGLTGIIDALGNKATSLAESFGQLPESIQKVILVTGGVIAVAGPLAFALGALVAVTPAVVAGFTLISTTIGAALAPIALGVAAVAGAAILIAVNWDKVKKTLTDSGIWDSVVGLVTSGMEAVKAVIGAAILFARTVWDRLGGWLTAAASVAFNGVVAVFSAGAGIVQGIFTTLTGILTLDWRKSLDGLVIIAKSIWNLLIDGFKLLAQVVGETVANIFRTFGGTTIADKVTEGLDKALTKIDGLKGKINAVAVATASVKPIATGGRANTSTPEQPFDYSKIDLSGSGIKKLKDQLKAAKEAVDSFKALNPGKAVPPELLTRYRDLAARVKEATSATKAQREEHIKSLTVLQNLELALKLVNDEIQEKRALGITVPASAYHEVDNISAAIRRVKGEADIDLRLKPTGVSLAVQTFQDGTERVGRFADGLKARFEELTKKGTLSAINEQITKIRDNLTRMTLAANGEIINNLDLARLREYNAQLRRVQDAQDLTDVATNPSNGGGGIFSSAGVGADAITVMMGQINSGRDAVNLGVATLKAAMESGRQQLRDAGVGLLEGLGESIGKGESPLKNALKSILGLLGNFVIQLGTALLFSSAALLAAAPLTFGITLAPGLAQQLAGAGLIVAGGVIKGIGATAFANGGLVSGPTYAWIGEGRGTTKNNPEVVTPLDRLKSMLGNRGGTQVFIPDVQLEGSMIRIALNRSDDDDSYFR